MPTPFGRAVIAAPDEPQRRNETGPPLARVLTHAAGGPCNGDRTDANTRLSYRPHSRHHLRDCGDSGAIGLLLADAIDTGRWTQEHALVPLVVGLTVATGYLASTALWRARLLAAIGFAVAFAIGTTITVLNGVGRQSEGVAVRMAEASRHNKVVADKAADLNRARLRLEQANQMAERRSPAAAAVSGATIGSCGR